MIIIHKIIKFIFLEDKIFCKNTNENTKMRSLKSSENVRKKESGSDKSVSNNKFSSVNLNELAMKASESILLFQISTRKSIQRLICPSGCRIAIF